METHDKVLVAQKILLFQMCKLKDFLFFSDSWLFFSGGMPRASYGDKFTVTVKRSESQVPV